jgi:hypothetical protein
MMQPLKTGHRFAGLYGRQVAPGFSSDQGHPDPFNYGFFTLLFVPTRRPILLHHIDGQLCSIISNTGFDSVSAQQAP